ncbi:MAG: DsbA family protein [Betaproteobacteria bacterium]
MPQHDRFELHVPVQPIDHVLGSAQAQVTVVEYSDFECPNCKAAAPGLKLLLKRFEAKVRVVYRHFPLEEVHPHALLAAQAAEAAAAQDRFWPMHDLLFENQNHLKPNQLRGYADHLELDLTRFDAELADQVYLQRVREQIEGGRRSGVHGTPAFFVNGTIQDVSFGMEALFAAVESVLRR